MSENSRELREIRELHKRILLKKAGVNPGEPDEPVLPIDLGKIEAFSKVVMKRDECFIGEGVRQAELSKDELKDKDLENPFYCEN